MPEPPNITTLPHAAVKLIGNHIALQLNDLVKVKKSHWKGNIKTAFSKMQYIYNKASMRSNKFSSRGVNKKQMLLRAAEAMDMECGMITMAQYLAHLNKNGPKTMRQARERVYV
eukprot:6272677-Ditylum_brightwellii.AAC.1